MAGALSMLSAAGCDLVGGHTCEGADLALGFSVTVRHFCIPAASSSSRFGSALAIRTRAPATSGVDQRQPCLQTVAASEYHKAAFNVRSLSVSNLPLLTAESC